MGLFKKKKKKEEETEEETEDSNSSSSNSSGKDSVSSAQFDKLSGEVTKINGILDSLKEARNMSNERFSTINEQIGELRGTINDVQRSVGKIEVKATKAADMVESVHPDKLMIQVQKSDGKIEGLRGILEAKEEMMKNVMDQVRKIRNTVTVFRGIEQVIKLNEEVKDELMDVKKISAAVERHADRTDNVFLEAQKSFEAFNAFADKLDDLKSEVKDLTKKADKTEVETLACVKKKDFDDRLKKIEKFDKEAKNIIDDLKKYRKKMEDEFKTIERKLRAEFEFKIEKAEIISEAFDDLLKQNPMFAEGLELQRYLKRTWQDDALPGKKKTESSSEKENNNKEENSEETSETEATKETKE